jgi:signal transduction histidine kinase
VRLLRYVLWPAGLAFGIAAEWADHVAGPALSAADFLVGFALIALGLVAWGRRPETWMGPIMSVAGFAWFLGTFAGWAVYLHRGPLAHLVISYPAGRLRSRLERAAVAAGYAYATVYPVARNDYATLVFAVGLVVVCSRRYAVAGGAERRARASALAAAMAFGLVLVTGALIRLEEGGADLGLLWAYDVVVLVVAVGLFADLMWGRWTQAALTGLVVDLGDVAAAGSLRDKLSRALGDPSLAVGFWVEEERRYVDEAGRPVELARGERGRTVTAIDDDGTPVAALIHDAAVLDDPGLVAAVASATRLAVFNVRLQAEVRARVADVEASRRRIVEAGDAQRRRLERELREGAQRRLAHVAELLEASGPRLGQVRHDLNRARSDLGELARGIHPAALTDGGLAVALTELVTRCGIPVEVSGPAERLPEAVEAAAYFVCSEGLANVVKHAQATRAEIVVAVESGRLVLRISDDGGGGADPARGSGLRGLADRIEALGGRLRAESPLGDGTLLIAEIPLT